MNQVFFLPCIIFPKKEIMQQCNFSFFKWESMASFVPKRTSLDLMVRNWLILASLTQPVVRNLSLVILAKISRSLDAWKDKYLIMNQANVKFPKKVLLIGK